MKAALLLLLLVVVGCAPAVPFDHLTISTEFPVHVQAAFIDGAEAWFQAAPSLRVPVTVGEPANVRVTPYGARDPDCVDSDGYVVWRFLEPAELRLCEADPFNLQFLVMHELGHALGGTEKHLPEGNLMFPHAWGASLVPTAEDLAFLGVEP